RCSVPRPTYAPGWLIKYRKLPDVGTLKAPDGSVTPGVGGGLSIRIRPKSAGPATSQCCSNVASKTRSSPVGANETSVTSNCPLAVLHPRPSPETASAGATREVELLPVAPVYKPGASMLPGPEAIVTDQPWVPWNAEE